MHQENLTGSSIESLLLLGNAFIASRALHTIAQEKIADLFQDDRPQSVEILAKEIGSSPIALKRIIRAVCPFGVFYEHEDGRFSLTEMGRYLQSNHPCSMRDLLLCEECRWNSIGQMNHTLKTGKSSFSKIYQTGYFDYIAQRPDLQKGFDDHMKAVSTEEDPIIAAKLPLGQKQHCVDIGGGKGGLLRAILDTHPHIRGGVFDLPGVAKEELANLSKQYQDRFEFFTGSFFETLPFHSDTLVLKRILHDWDDSHCIDLLSHCREALSEDGEIYIVESILEGKEDPPLLRIFDLLLLTVFGGFERTIKDYEGLFAQARLQLKEIIPTESGMSILVVTR